jgi:uncharacterized membrane protein YfcA
VPASIAGVWVIQLLEQAYSEDQLNSLVLGILGAALLVVGAAVFMRAIFLSDVIPERHAMHLYRRHKVAAITTGALTGFVIGLTSTGSGTLVAITLIAVFRLTLREWSAPTSSTALFCRERRGSRTRSPAT